MSNQEAYHFLVLFVIKLILGFKLSLRLQFTRLSQLALCKELKQIAQCFADHFCKLLRGKSTSFCELEGYKRDGHAKVEAHRAETGNALIAPEDPTIKAIASDTPMTLDRPVFDLNDTSTIADFILAEVGL